MLNKEIAKSYKRNASSSIDKIKKENHQIQ